MKFTTLPSVPSKLVFDDTCDNHKINDELFKKVTKKKSEIDSVQHKWDSAKKISNDYEYIYTSSNYRKNISSIVPVSRSFFKLREIIYDFRSIFPSPLKNTCHSTLGYTAEATYAASRPVAIRYSGISDIYTIN